MLNGNISNRIEPRLLVVFEGLLGLHTDAKDRAKYSASMKLHRYRSAIRTFTLNEQLQKVIWDTTWRKGYAVDVVTFLDERLAEPLADLLDEQSLPVSHVTYSDKMMLARSLNSRPDVAGVFYSDPADRFTFGGKGYGTSVNTTSLIGVLGQHGR